MLVERFDNNPLITPSDVPPSRPDYEVVGAFNAGATIFNDEILLLMRVAERPKDKKPDEEVAPIFNPLTGQIDLMRVPHGDPELEIPDSRVFDYQNKTYLTSISHLRIARSSDGRNFSIDETPAVFPEKGYETFGLEDPRITQIGCDYYIVYKVVSAMGIGTALLQTRDFKDFRRLGIIFCPENIDVVLFPEKINEHYFALTRPVVKHIGPLAIWSASSPDLLHWGNHMPVIAPRPGCFDSGRVGASCVPIKTPQGWLEIYHAADTDNRYCLAAALLDLDQPWKVLSYSKEPLMQPQADYEIKGFFGNVVFSCGHVQTDSDEIIIYYGAADECTCAAKTSISAILNHLQ